MGKHLYLFIWILLMKSTNGQYLFDDQDERQQISINSVMHFLKSEVQQLTKSVEKTLFQKLEEFENNMQAKINTRIENLTKNIVENFTKNLENKLACAGNETLISGKLLNLVRILSLVHAPL